MAPSIDDIKDEIKKKYIQFKFSIKSTDGW